MPDTERKALANHQPVSPTTIFGWPAVIFSLPFLAAGAFIVLMSLDVIHVSDSKFHAARPLVAAFGGLFFLAGLSVFVHGVISLQKKREKERLKKERPDEIWHADYHWDRTGIKGNNSFQAFTALYGAFGFTVFMIPFNWLVFSASLPEKIPFFVKMIIGVFDLVILLVAARAVYLLLRYFKYGDSRLTFHRFPFFLGDKIDVVLHMNRPVQGMKDLEVILRFVEEQYEVRGTGKNRQTVVVSYQVYADTKPINGLAVQQFGPLRVPISFPLPAGGNYQTALGERPAKYWQLSLKGQAPGVDYSEDFFLPVYAGR